MAWFVDNPLATPVQPVCFKCGAPMWLIRIEPDNAGRARRTFECPRCQNQMTEVIDLEKAASLAGGRKEISCIQCPLWVRNGHGGTVDQCPLVPRKRASPGAGIISALRQ